MKVKGSHIYGAFLIITVAALSWWSMERLVGTTFSWLLTVILALAGFMIVTSAALLIPRIEKRLTRFIARMPGGSENGSVYQAIVTIVCIIVIVESMAVLIGIQTITRPILISPFLIPMALLLWLLESVKHYLKQNTTSSLIIPGMITLYFALFGLPIGLSQPLWFFDLVGVEVPAIVLTAKVSSTLF